MALKKIIKFNQDTIHQNISSAVATSATPRSSTGTYSFSSVFYTVPSGKTALVFFGTNHTSLLTFYGNPTGSFSGQYIGIYPQLGVVSEPFGFSATNSLKFIIGNHFNFQGSISKSFLSLVSNPDDVNYTSEIYTGVGWSCFNYAANYSKVVLSTPPSSFASNVNIAYFTGNVIAPGIGATTDTFYNDLPYMMLTAGQSIDVGFSGYWSWQLGSYLSFTQILQIATHINIEMFVIEEDIL